MQIRIFLAVCLLFYSFYCSAQLNLKEDSSKVNQLNSTTEGEAFPFISGDGLRLYFTSTKEGMGRVYLSERLSIDSPFLIARPLSRNLPDSFFGATLTADELEIYLFDAWKPYYSKRASKNEDFSFPALIKELGACHRNPAISPNGLELIVVNGSGCDSSGRARDTIRLFSKGSSGIFERNGILNYPKNFDPGPGQFSKDGLSYIMTVSKRWYDYDRAWVDSVLVLKYDRSSLNSPFGDYQIIFNELDRKPRQLTFDASGSILIGVLFTKIWEWKSNNLIYFIRP